MRIKELTERIDIRVSPFEKNRLQWLADKYANGNLSLFIMYNCLSPSNQKIDPSMIKHFSKRRNKLAPR
jgi:hypothetical protein